jgi:hypothetical protein
MNTERAASIREARRETFRKWATLVIASLGLMVACLRDPLSWTLRATIEGVLHQELAKFELVSPAGITAPRQPSDFTSLLLRFDRDLTALLNENASRDERNCQLLLDDANRLSVIQANLSQLVRQNEVFRSAVVNSQSTNPPVSRGP